jgi:hypothetical protein
MKVFKTEVRSDGALMRTMVEEILEAPVEVVDD